MLAPSQTPDVRDLRLVHAAVAEAARRDLVHDARQRRALLLERHRVVHVLVPEVLDRRRQVPEEDWCTPPSVRGTNASWQDGDKTRTDVALPDLLRNLDVRTVDGADEKATVQAELHVGRARRLRAGRGDVLGDIGGGDEDLGEGDGIVGEEEEGEEVLGVGVLVDDACDVDDKADGLSQHSQ